MKPRITFNQKQVADQCELVEEMAYSLAETIGPQARLYRSVELPKDLVKHKGEQTHRLMEALGDTLNALDAVLAEDMERATSIFKRARSTFPLTQEDSR